MTCHLALDLGAESGRAIVGVLEHGALTLHEVHRFPNIPLRAADGLHWDMPTLWNEIQASLAAARAFPVVSVGLDTWGVDFALLDRQGALLSQPYHYRDSRTDGMMTKALRRVPRGAIFAQTGIQFMPINTLYQLLALVEQSSPLLEAAHTFLTIPDLFNYWLTGAITAEFTNATTTQCFNLLTHNWAFPLLEALNIPTHFFPPVAEPGTILGPLTLPQASPLSVVAPACHDTGSAVVAVPAENKDFVWLSSGTWSIMGVEAEAPNLGARALALNFTNEGGVNGTWRLSKNIMGLWLIQGCQRAWDIAYEDIARLAAEARPFLAVIDPDDSRFLHPADMPEAIRAFCGDTHQPLPHTRGEVARVALESLALKYRWVLEQLEALTGRPLAPLHIVGGGARNDLLNQWTANCLGRVVIAGPFEATAIGNLLMQAIALKELTSLAEARAVVRRSLAVRVFEPQRDERWEAGCEKLTAVMNRESP